MESHARKFDPERMAYLESEERRRLLDPDRVLGIIEDARGSIAADIGCGPGAFTLPLARAVGEGGKVYALDTEPKMISRLEERLKTEGIRNVTPILSSEDSLPLPSASVDFALLITVLHELDGLGTLLETARILKETGVLLVVDWKKKDEPVGPPSSQRLSEEEASFLLIGAGFSPGSPFDVGGSHYGFKAVKT